MTTRRVVVLDPGKTTGVVEWDTRPFAGVQPFTARELNFKDTCSYLMNVASGYMVSPAQDTVIVAESFIITPATAKNSQAPWSLEVIGVARMVCEVYIGRELRLQQAAAAKRFSSDARLKRAGFWTPGKGHANDASRHLLLYLATHGLLGDELLTEFASMP